MSINRWVTAYFSSKDISNKLNHADLLSFNYVDNQFLTSIEFVEMIADIEDKFAITFTDAEMNSDAFMTIGGLINIIEKK